MGLEGLTTEKFIVYGSGQIRRYGPRPLILLYGGAFDPVHRGHLAMAARAWAATGADRLCFLPAGQSPFKPSGHVSAAHRLAMLRQAVAALPGAEIDDQELHRRGRSYR